MKNTFIIARRELGAYFNSPIAYVVVAVFLLLSALLFFSALFLQGQAELRELFDGFWTTLLVAIVGPAITMRLLAEERSNDTLEVLLTMPLTDWDVVLGKYLAALGVFGFAMLMMSFFGATVAMIGPLDKGPAFAGFVGLFLVAATYMAIGLMTSSFTKNQIVAFIGAVLAFDVKGGRDAAWAVVDATRICSIAANFGDVRTIITHPASTTHGRLTETQRQAAGIGQGMIRLGVGLEHLEDLKADLARGLDPLAS